MKNDVFNFNRFGRYLVTDTKNAINRYGISLLVLAAFSFAGYLLAGLFSSVVNGSWYSMPVAGRVTIFLFVTTIVLAMAPAKMFGFITDKKEGSDFLMLPASPLEKTISMVIISCIFMPLVFFAVYLCAIPFFNNLLGMSTPVMLGIAAGVAGAVALAAAAVIAVIKKKKQH